MVLDAFLTSLVATTVPNVKGKHKSLLCKRPLSTDPSFLLSESETSSSEGGVEDRHGGSIPWSQVSSGRVNIAELIVSRRRWPEFSSSGDHWISFRLLSINEIVNQQQISRRANALTSIQLKQHNRRVTAFVFRHWSQTRHETR